MLTGLPFSGASRNAVGAKSPLTGGFGAAEVGGFWGAEFKRAGFDALIVEGASPKPVYLWIKDGQAELRDAASLWGKDTKETQEAMRAELGDKRVGCAMIGPGGENLVRYACVMNETQGRRRPHRPGRGDGLQEAQGRGRARHQPAWTAPIRTTIQDLARWAGQGRAARASWPLGLHSYGTGARPGGRGPHRQPAHPQLPRRRVPRRGRHQREHHPGQDRRRHGGLLGLRRALQEGRQGRARPTRSTPTMAGPSTRPSARSARLRRRATSMAVSKANELCNAYSLDTIATGVTIAFAMECYENGLLTKEDTDGIDLRFGNGEAHGRRWSSKIAHREGFGALLAEGYAAAAAKIGSGAERFAMQVKGQEYPMHEPRFKRGAGHRLCRLAHRRRPLPRPARFGPGQRPTRTAVMRQRPAAQHGRARADARGEPGPGQGARRHLSHHPACRAATASPLHLRALDA